MNTLDKVKTYIGTAGLLVMVAAAVVYRIKPDWKLYCLIGAGVGVLLFLAYIVINFREVKEALGGRTTLYSLNTFLAILLVLGIIGLLNFLSSRHHKRWDITEGKIHSLSDQSVKVLRNLDKNQRDVEVSCFFKEGDAPEAKMRDMLDMYQAETRRLKVQFFDPAKNPGLAKKYNIEEYNTTVLTSGDKEVKIKGLGEEDITNALIQVSREARKTLYFLEGHGEIPIDQADDNGYSHLKEQLEKENYVVKKLMLVREPGIPHDCSVLIGAGPRVSVTSPEIRVINDYLVAGGRALFMIDPRTSSGLESSMLQWGVRVGNNIIIDRAARVFGGSELMPIGAEYEEHPITKRFNYATAYPMARSVDVTDKNDHGAAPTVIARTSQESWAETNMEMLDNGMAQYDEGHDQEGPIPIIVAVTAEGKKKEPAEGSDSEKKLEEKAPQTRFVVIGDSEFPNNTYYGFSGNGNLFLNTVAWLAEEEDLISIRPSTQAPKTISMSREQASLIFYSTLILLPGLVLIVGIVVWARRRNK